jgi:hypothetical protein
MPYCPDQFEHDAHKIAGRYWEKWPRSFLTFSIGERYPWRMWRTMAGLLLIGKGRPRFRCTIKDISAASGQCDRTTQRALVDLEIDGWVERKFLRQDGSKFNLWTKYTLPHLLPSYPPLNG